jgi:hypothetical protein
MLSQTDPGRQDALVNIVSAIKQGVEKLIIMDPSVNRESPFAFDCLQNLNNDLHSLMHLGMASAFTSGTLSRLGKRAVNDLLLIIISESCKFHFVP